MKLNESNDRRCIGQTAMKDMCRIMTRGSVSHGRGSVVYSSIRTPFKCIFGPEQTREDQRALQASARQERGGCLDQSARFQKFIILFSQSSMCSSRFLACRAADWAAPESSYGQLKVLCLQYRVQAIFAKMNVCCSRARVRLL